MATKQELFNQIVAYGIQNKKRKEDIMTALLSSGQFDVASSASALKALGDLGSFDYQQEQLQPGQISQEKVAELGTGALRQKFDALREAKKQLSNYKNLIDKYTGKTGVKLTGQEAADLRTAKSQLLFTIATASGTGALQEADRKIVEDIIPDPTNLTSAAGIVLRGGKSGALTSINRAMDTIDNNINLAIGGQTTPQTTFATPSQAGQPTQPSAIQTTGQVQPGFAEAIQFAQQNPNDPNSIKLREAIQSGKIDPITGQKLQTVKTPQSGQTPDTGQIQAPEQGMKPTTEEKGMFSRFLSSAVKQIPELAGDLGGRLKNVWDNIAETSTKAKDRSVFENVLRGFETQFRGLGEAGGALTDVAGSALKIAYDTAYPESKREEIKNVASEFMQSPTGQQAIQALQGGVQAWEEFKKNNPNIAKDAQAAFNIVTALPMVKGAVAAAEGAMALAKGTARSVKSAIPQIEERAAKKVLQEAIDVTSKTLNKKDAIGILEETGKGTTGTQEAGLLKKVTPVVTNQDKAVAESVQGLVKKTASASENIGNINKEITRIAENEIAPFLEQNNGIFNKNTIKSALKKIKVPDYIKTDKVLENTYNLVRQRMLDIIDKSPKNMKGLWDARKEFDRVIKEQFGQAAFEKRTVVNKAITDIRKEVNNFISENTPNGTSEFKGKLGKLSNMYEARHRIAEAGYKELGGNRFSRLAKRNPKTTKALKYGAGAYVGGKLYQGLAD